MLPQAVQFVSTLPKNSPEALYAEYEMLMARAIRCRVRADGRGKGRQGQILQQAWNKHAEWKKAIAAQPKPVSAFKSYTDWTFQAVACKKCSFQIALNQPRSILGEAFYHLECDPSRWADY